MSEEDQVKKTVLSEVTLLLQKWESGEGEALNEVVPLVYSELHAKAERCFNGENDRLLQATALVNEVYLRLAKGEKIHFKDRSHFFCIAGRMMRRILVEHARKRLTAKRGHNLNVTLFEETDLPILEQMDLETMIALDEALTRTEKDYPRQAQIFEWKVFSGLGNKEICQITGLSPATIKREWAHVKRRLFLVLRRK